MNDRRGALWALVALAWAIVLALEPGDSLAQSGAGPAPGDAEVTQIATGLLNPRGLAFGPDGWLYVAEAGSGGEQEAPASAGRYRIGHTARVSRVDPSGLRETVVDGLPSAQATFDELGAADLAFLDGTLYVLTAAGGIDVGDSAYDNAILRVDLSTAPPTLTPVFDLTRFNLENPSRSRLLDPARTNVPGGMPYGLAVLNGAFYVTDGNQEHVTRITLDGRAERLIEHSASDRVLTGITPGPDGELYIAEFGPLPHREGSARITRLAPAEGRHTAAVRKLVNAIDVAFDASGRMYVLEFAAPGWRTPATGRVLRVSGDEAREVVVAGLNFPTAMTFGPEGDLYVASPGHQASNGEGSILKVRIAT